MKTVRFFRLLIVRVVILAVCMMAWSYLTDYVQESTTLFEDFQYQKYSWDKELSWEWGWRHYVWCGLGVAMFLVSAARIITWGDWYWKQVNREDDVDLKSPENKIF